MNSTSYHIVKLDGSHVEYVDGDKGNLQRALVRHTSGQRGYKLDDLRVEKITYDGNNTNVKDHGPARIHLDSKSLKKYIKESYTVKQLLEVSRGEHSGYYIAGHVDTHGGQEDAGTKEFKVKYADYPSTSDIKKQNPHLKDHDVEAIMKHVDYHNQQRDDDFTDTTSEQKAGGKMHDVYIKTNKSVFKAKNEAHLRKN